MPFDLKMFGNKLQRYRLQLQLEIEEVSKKTGISRDRLAQLENGLSEPSGDEVLIFADFYKQNYNYFISNQQKTASEQVDILYRKYGAEFSKADRWALQEFLFICECEEFVFKSLNLEGLHFIYQPQGNYYKAHGEEAAIALRKSMGLKDDNIITNPYQTLRKLGVHIFRRKLNNSNISGLFINHPIAGKCVLVNYNEDIYRQNFTLAHEIGHAIFDYQDEINVSYENSAWTNRDLKEIRANTFASNFLIPKSIFNSFHVTKWNQTLILSLAKQLQVNIEPLLIAMKNAGAISAQEQDSFKQIKLSKVDKLDPELKGLSDRYYSTKLSLLERGISDFYIKNCFETYSRGFISSGRLSEMLLCNEKELSALLKNFNLQLSYDN